MKIFIRCALGFAGLLTMSIAVASEPVAACDQIERPIASAPRYPPELAAKQQGGTTVLLITVDECGRATTVDIEKSAGSTALDEAAREAALTWRLNPARNQASTRLRVPVSFDASGTAEKKIGDIPPDMVRMLMQWKRMQVPMLPLKKDGKLPSNAPDPLPIMTGSVAQTFELLRREAKLMSSESNRFRFEWNTNDGRTYWEVYPDGEWAFAPAVVRQRIVSDGKKSYLAVSTLCEAKARQCALLDQMLSEVPDQTPFAPPPPPPQALLDKLEAFAP